MTVRRWLVPEVIQTSATDCGVASLRCLLEGFGISASYGRLREACQTDVDGTSIDVLEEVAVQLGLTAEQILVPRDHVLLEEAGALPAIAVTELPNGFTHFVVLWRRHGRIVQVMDPASGRRWESGDHLLRELHLHTATIGVAAWRQWAETDEFLEPLQRRLHELGLERAARRDLNEALEQPGWRPLAALDASTRLIAAMVRSGALRPGRAATLLWKALTDRALCEPDGEPPRAVPEAYWLARPAPRDSEEPQLHVQGAVLLRVSGRRQASEAPAPGPSLSPELAAALEERPGRPGRALIGLLREDGWLSPGFLAAALALAAAGAALEAVLFRGLLDVRSQLSIVQEKLSAILLLAAFLGILFLLEYPIAAGLIRLGRRLEARLRLALLAKIPRLPDRYLHSRLTSDMASRSHQIHRLRMLPGLGGSLVGSSFQLLMTTIGLAWLDPSSGPVIVGVALLSVLAPLTIQHPLVERDLRVRTLGGAIARYHLDALVGLVAVFTHGAERALRREHETLVAEWVRARRALQRAAISVEALQAFFGFALAGWLLTHYLARPNAVSSILLLAFWSLSVPLLGQEIARLARQYPAHRNVTLRLLEPLTAPEGPRIPTPTGPVPKTRLEGAAGILLRNVDVMAGGHKILTQLNLNIAPGSHVAIVGPAGSGKSSLVGLLLGWHRPASGDVLVDRQPLVDESLRELRRRTAWVDPAIQLWNRSVLDNLRYGAEESEAHAFDRIIEQSDLRQLLQSLPDGLQTPLGESGGLVSGGEGQRVRFGRALLRPDARLVILDEPFRGLARTQRRKLLARARALWSHATLLCITHDVEETLAFGRVLVLEGGLIVEDDLPQTLASKPGSRYRRLLDAERSVFADYWSLPTWRRYTLQDGELAPAGSETP